MTKQPVRPTPVDSYVGSRVRLRRTMLGLSQEKLGQALGLTFQQVQKYERGTNRISASKLYRLSNILDVPVSFFFDGLPKDEADIPSAIQEAAPVSRLGLEHIKMFSSLPAALQRIVHETAKVAVELNATAALGGHDQDEADEAA